MRFSLFFCLLFFGVLYISLAQGSYEDCCLKYVKEIKSVYKRRVVGYRRQEQDGGCNLPAIVFKMKRILLCANPEEKWVQDLMKQTDKKIRQNKQIPPKRRNKQSKHQH